MPSPPRLVINTSPLLAIIAGCRSLAPLQGLYAELIVPVGCRFARLCGLNVTGAVGVLLRAHREGRITSVREATDQMRARGIWLSEAVVTFALRESGEG